MKLELGKSHFYACCIALSKMYIRGHSVFVLLLNKATTCYSIRAVLVCL